MRNMVKSSLLFLFSLLILSSCTKSFESPEEMHVYLQEEDNGYNYKKTVAGVDYVLQYRPTDLLVQQELGDKTDAAQIENLRKRYGKYMYFNLSMSKNNQ